MLVEGGRNATNYRGGYDFTGMLQTVRELRRSQTPAEAVLWELLRGRRLLNLKFRRQHQIGDYVTDFYCHEAKLVVELDGGVHADKAAKDRKRDAFMQGLGLTVLRFPNEQLLDAPESVLQTIANSAQKDTSAPSRSPSPAGRGGGEGAEGLGWIPKGWEVGRLADVAEIGMGQSPKGTTYNAEDSGVPLVNGPAEYGENRPVKIKWTTAPTRLCEPGDLIFCVRGSTTGRRVVADDVYCMGRGVCTIRGRNGWQAYVDQLVETSLVRLLARTTGSVFPNLSGQTLQSFPTLVPNADILNSFSAVTAPWRSKQSATSISIQTLAALCDTLLPKLRTGEVTVPESMFLAVEE